MRAAAAARKGSGEEDGPPKPDSARRHVNAGGPPGGPPPHDANQPGAPPPPGAHRWAAQFGASRDGLHALLEASCVSGAASPATLAARQMLNAPALGLSGLNEAGRGGPSSPRGALNQRLEDELPAQYACTAKVTVELPSAAPPSPKGEENPQWEQRRKAMHEFQWRRLFFDGCWIVVPSLLAHEVNHIDSSIREQVAKSAAVDAPDSAFGIAKFPVAAPEKGTAGWEEGSRGEPLCVFQWRRLFFGTQWVLVPSLRDGEVQLLNEQIAAITSPRQRKSNKEGSPSMSMVPTLGDKAEDEIRKMVDDMTHLKKLLASVEDYTHNSDQPLKRVAMIVVVEAEVKPIMEKFGFADNEELTRKFLGLARVRSGDCGGYTLFVIKVAESKIFNRHYSGYSQSAAIAALTASNIAPDLVVSFGTAGGVPGRCGVGDTVWANGCLFLDRLRTRNKNAFDWGVWGGGCCRSSNIAAALGLVSGPVASQIGYTVSSMQERLIEKSGIYCLDMEAGPIAQILNQTGTNFVALKVISNGVYPGEPRKMEAEYHDHRDEVSRRATEVLGKVLTFLSGKKVGDL